ncbi:MAG: PLP-dependent aminotransferase family protein [Rhodospirillaceae bacterium]
MAIWLPDLQNRTGPKYLQIVEAMAEDIASGRLADGTQLPPHRELAYQLGVSANTTSRAYAEAVNRALLRGEVGRGTFVRAARPSVPGSAPESLQRASQGPIDLSRNLPLPGLAEPHVRRVLRQLAAEDSQLPALLDYQTEQDLLHHQQAGQNWLAACGVTAEPEDILPVIGGQHALHSLLVGVLRPGDLLLTEALTYPPVLAMAAALGLQTKAVAMDGAGVLPDAFEAWCQEAKPKAFYLTPTLQAPTTVTLSASRRTQIAAIAQRYGVLLIEDDVFGPLHPAKPPPLVQFAPDHTAYVTSLSKSVAPGLRVGFLTLPRRLKAAVQQAITMSVWMTPPMTLEVATRLVADGTAALLTQQQRRIVAQRQAMAQQCLGAEWVPDLRDGHHLWLPLPSDWRADVFVAECARAGALVTEGRAFAHVPNAAPNAIRLCLSHEAEETRLRQGLETVAGLLQQKPSGSALVI